MNTLVLIEWQASDQPVDAEGHFVRIVGRASGLISWLLALVKINPITSISVSQDHIEFTRASLSGMETRIIPIGKVSASYYGYKKPWKSALFFSLPFATFLNLPGYLFGSSGSGVVGFLGWLFGVVLAAAGAVIYYYLRRTLTLGFTEISGVSNAIAFKRSVIENVDINEAQARYICEIVQCLVEANRNLSPTQFADADHSSPPLR